MASSIRAASEPWAFEPVFELLEAFRHGSSALPALKIMTLNSSPSLPAEAEPEPELEPEPGILGDLSAVWSFMDMPHPSSSHASASHAQSPRSACCTSFIPVPKTEPHDSTSDQSADYNELSSNSSVTSFEGHIDREHFDEFVRKKKEVQWDLVPSQVIHPSIRRTSQQLWRANTEDTSDVDSGVESSFREKPKQAYQVSAPLGPLHLINCDRRVIRPFDTLKPDEKRRKLATKLARKFNFSPTCLSGEGIHVFVDISNIVIGFYNAIKAARGIPEHQYVFLPHLVFSFLAMIMERNRPVSRRILAGSIAPPTYNEIVEYPRHVLEAERCGYEINMLERVWKRKAITPRKGSKRIVASSGSASEGGSLGLPEPRLHEQGVDEVLHMKMLESITDTDRAGTIVLATGDAAAAEYSPGFLVNVERALKKGWKVELVAWKSQLGGAYRALQKKWTLDSRFSIIELDQYSEDLLGSYTSNLDSAIAVVR